MADSFCGHDFDMNEGGNPLKFGLALYGCFENRDTPRNGWFIMENLIF